MSSDIQKGNPTAYKNIIAPTTEIETLLDEGERNIDDPDAGIDKATADKIAEIGRNTDPAAERKLSFSQNAKKGFKNLKAKAKEQAKGYGKRATEDLKRMAKSKMEEAEIEAKRYVNRRIPNLENIYGKTMRALDAATNVRGIASGIESVVGKNVHFLDGTPLVDVLNKANRDALISIGNVYKR
jgi:F0F1-type ATP synthase membrane subunit b/b'